MPSHGEDAPPDLQDRRSLISIHATKLPSGANRYIRVQPQGVPDMMKIAFSVAAAAAILFTAPISMPVQAQSLDVQVGRDRDRDFDRDRRHRYESGTTVGIGPGGVTVGRRDRCRTVTTTVERDDGRMIKKRERICD
jgi:hypothetical protein